MESGTNNLGMVGLSVLLDVAVTVLIVTRLCRSKLICNFNKSSLVLFNLLILIFCTILIRLDISMGTGVGLFAVLAMFRFRSEVLKTQEMFYLLMLIGIGFVHAAFPDVLSLTELLFIDGTLLGMAYFLSHSNKPTKKFKITLNDVELIKPSNQEKIKSLLEKNLGYVIKKIEVVNVNFKKKRVEIELETDGLKHCDLPDYEQTQDHQLEITHIEPASLAIN